VQRSVSAHRIFPSTSREWLIPLELREPTDRRRIKNDLGALNRVDSSGFGIPLVVADKRRNDSIDGLHLDIAKISGREIILFVVIRIVRDMHLAIFPRKPPGGVIDQSRVVELSVIASFVNRSANQCHAVPRGTIGKVSREPARYPFCYFEEPV